MRRVALVLAGLALTAGCATVPTEGAVRPGIPIGAGERQGGAGVGIMANPPRDGAPPQQIVDGFREAMGDTISLDTARKFLTPDADARWQPGSRVYVFDGTGVSLEPRGNVYRFSARLAATLDERSAYRPAPPGKLLQYDFKLAKVDGQWRITNPPNGVFVDKNVWQSNFGPQNLYFLTPSSDLLVPDPIYLPVGRSPSQLANMLLQALLAGPTSRLGDSVRSAAPPGTQLVGAATVDDNGVVNVDLNDAVAGLGQVDRNQLAAQITWTLRNVAASKVRITVNGAPLLDTDNDERVLSDFGSFDPTVPTGTLTDLYVLKQGKIHKVEGLDGSSEITLAPVDQKLLSAYYAESLAISLRSEFAAIVNTEGSSGNVIVARIDGSTAEPQKEQKYRTEGRVTRPTWDWQGNLWWVDRAGSGSPRVSMRDGDGELHQVKTDLEEPVTALRVAPDGVRVAAVVGTGERSRLMVGRIRIGENGARSMEGFTALDLPLRDLLDVGWSKPDRLTVVGRHDGDNKHQPWAVNVDGSVLVAESGIADIEVKAVATSVDVETRLVVLDENGHMLRRAQDLQWANPLQDPSKVYPVYPG